MNEPQPHFQNDLAREAKQSDFFIFYFPVCLCVCMCVCLMHSQGSLAPFGPLSCSRNCLVFHPAAQLHNSCGWVSELARAVDHSAGVNWQNLVNELSKNKEKRKYILIRISWMWKSSESVEGLDEFNACSKTRPTLGWNVCRSNICMVGWADRKKVRGFTELPLLKSDCSLVCLADIVKCFLPSTWFFYLWLRNTKYLIKIINRCPQETTHFTLKTSEECSPLNHLSIYKEKMLRCNIDKRLTDWVMTYLKH